MRYETGCIVAGSIFLADAAGLGFLLVFHEYDDYWLAGLADVYISLRRKLAGVV